MVEILRDYGDSVVSVLVAFVAAVGAIWAFYLQKEYELVRQRYLEEGLDRLAADIDHAAQVERQLFQRGLNLLRQFRELGDQLPRALLTERVTPIDMGRFSTITNLRVQNLIGNDALWGGLQLAYARVRQFYDFIYDDYVHQLGLLVDGSTELNIPKAEFLKISEDAIVAFHTTISRDTARLMGLIQQLVNELETHRFSLTGVRKFRKRPNVRAVIIEAASLINEMADRPRDGSGVPVLNPAATADRTGNAAEPVVGSHREIA